MSRQIEAVRETARSWPRVRYEYVLLALLGAAALLSRFLLISRKSVWLDEAVSWRFANVSLRSMIDLTAHDKHPPVYYGILHFWVGLFGNSEAALRAPSAIAGAATIMLLAAVGWRVGGWLLGLGAGLLLMLNPAHLAASQEARMYALAGFLTVAGSIVLASYITKPSLPRLLAYAALMTALIYTHYSGMFVVGLHGLLFAAYGLHELLTKKRASILLGGLGTLAFLGLAYVPWISTFRTHLRQGVPYDIPEPSASYVRAISQSLVGLNDAHAFWLILALPLLGLGMLGVAKRWRDPLVVCLAAIALVPPLQIIDTIAMNPVFNLRQAAPYTPGLAFVIALGVLEMMSLARRWPRVTHFGYAGVAALAIALVVVMGVRFGSTYTAPLRQDWRSIAADLSGTHEAIYIAPGHQWQSLAYYRGSMFSTHPIWSADVNRIQQGADPVPVEQRQSDAILIVQNGTISEKVVLPAFKRDFDVEGLKQYPSGFTTYRLHPLAASP